MDGCRVVGPRGLCRPLDEKQGFSNKQPGLAPPSAKTGSAGRAGQGGAGQGPAWGPRPLGGTPRPPKKAQMTPTVVGLGFFFIA